MNRRGFLTALGAAVATIALPDITLAFPEGFTREAGGIVMRGQTIWLDKTLIIPANCGKVLITDCTFKRLAGFDGNCISVAFEGSQVTVNDCSFFSAAHETESE